MTERHLELLQESAREIVRLREQVRESAAPIAIVGMACRAPGGIATPEAYWSLLSAGEESIGPFPSRRGQLLDLDWRGGFLDDIEHFDAAFFGISPREALSVEPQQRLTLELAWEALEHAGYDPGLLRESLTGVFMGAQSSDYGLVGKAGLPTGYEATGQAISVLAGRVCYALDLRGPALTVDTACSSSLLSVHLACTSLRLRECDLALAGGAQAMCTAQAYSYTSGWQMMSPDGRCKAFSAEAEGAGWAEGAGVVVLKRLAEAQRDGDRILAVIKGSAVNQDGKSQGLTAPNGPSQERVMRRALASAGVTAGEVDVVEAHGTGTRLGDPIEANALARVYGKESERRGHRLWLGTVKSNLGHAQAAAGILSLLKMVLALSNESLPRTLHCQRPTPLVDWKSSGLELLQEARAWPRSEARVRRAGVSSFGISGTNVHLIVEEAPPEEVPATQLEAPPVVPILLSGKTPGALAENARRLALRLQNGPAVSLGELAFSLATRTHFEVRRGLLGSREDASRGYPELVSAMRALAPLPNPLPTGGLCIVFAGQGSQRRGMGMELEAQPGFEVFGDTYGELLQACDGHLGCSLRDVIRTGVDLDETRFAQPALFCLQLSLFEQWRAWGLRPKLLLGHSVGELSAACAAGALDRADGVKLVCARGQLMSELARPGGAMLVVPAGELEARSALESLAPEWRGSLEVAAVNSEAQTVISGDSQAIEALFERLKQEGKAGRRLPVSHAFHSAHLEPMLEPFARIARSLSYGKPRIPIWSCCNGGKLSCLDGEYWVRQVREPVFFADGVRACREAGANTFLECGPQVALSLLMEGGVPSLQAEGSEVEALMRCLTSLFERGHTVDWRKVLAPYASRRAELPTYAFERQRFWPVPPLEATSEWCYEERWRPLSAAPAEWRRRCWLVGASVEPAWLMAASRGQCEARALSLEQALESLIEDPGDGLTLVYLPEASQPWQSATGEALRLSQALTGKKACLWICTPHSLSILPEERPRGAALQTLWGFGRALILERPSEFGGLLDLPANPLSAEELMMLLSQVMRIEPDQDELALREGRLLARRLGRTSLPLLQSPWRARGTVLLTGGTGALGADLVRWLVRRGAQRLVLVSRHGELEGEELIRWSEEAGAKLEVRACDVTDRVAVGLLLSELSDLKHVFHLAGLVGAGEVPSYSPESLCAEASAKIQGAWNLHSVAAEAGLVLEDFVLFGSVAGFWGAGYQAAYSAANAGLTGLAQHRRARGMVATVIHWGPWAQGRPESASARTYLARRGLLAMEPRAAVELLERALASGRDDIAIARIDWRPFAQSYGSFRARSLFAELPEAAIEVLSTSQSLQEGSRDGLAGLSPQELRARLVEIVRMAAAEVLGMPDPTSLSLVRPLLELGLDSLMAAELRTRLVARTGAPLRATLAIDHPTVERMVEFLVSELESRPGLSPSSVLVPLKEGTAAPLFVIPGIWGGVLGFRELASELPAELPVIALDVDGLEPPERYSLERVAECFVREIRRSCPAGPVHLLGFSSGGLYAFEMAKLLGPQVGSVFLLNSYAPGMALGRRSPMRDSLARLEAYARIALAARPHEVWRLLRGRWKSLFGSPPITLDLWLSAQYYQMPDRGGYGGKVHLIRYGFQPGAISDPSLGWEKLLPCLTVHQTLGVHSALALQQPVARRTARLIGSLLGGE